MGDWIKNNKFEAGLLLVVLVVVGVAYFLSGKWGTRYELAKENFDGSQRDIANFRRLKPSPTEARKREFAGLLVDYRKKAEALQKELGTFRPKELEKIEPSEFTNRLNANIEKLRELYEARVGKQALTDEGRG